MRAFKALLRELAHIARQARRTWSFLTTRQRAVLGIAMLIMAAVGYLTAQIPLVLGGLVDAMLAKSVTSLMAAYPYLLTLGVFYLAREALQIVRKMLVEQTCTTLARDATVKAVSRLLVLDLWLLMSERAGTLNGRLARCVEGLVRLLRLSFLEFLPAAFGAAFALATALQHEFWLGLLMAGVVPLGLLVTGWQLASQRGIRVSLLAAKEKMDGSVVELLGGIESVRAANTAGLETTKVFAISEELRAREMRHHVAMGWFDGAKNLNEAAFHIGVVTVALAMALSGAISIGGILVFSMLFLAIMTPLRDIHRIVDEGQESAIRAEAFYAMIDQPADPSFDVYCGRAPAIGPGDVIEARHLELAYPGQSPDSKVNHALRDVSLAVRPGEVIGLAGPSGSGKTTFVRALLRLAHLTGGDLLVGGVPIGQLGREDIGRLFGLVSQQPFLFSGTVAENIAYGSAGATAEAIKAAAAKANIDAEIRRMPLQYGTPVAERGANLSGGQRQRIALARIFLQNPPILILDEATAALDNENERAVMDAVAKAMGGRTVFMIAHRLDSLKRANRILMFDQGRIVQSGTYTALEQERTGLFASLLFGDESVAPLPTLAARDQFATSSGAAAE